MNARTTIEIDPERSICQRYSNRIRAYGLCHLRDAASTEDLVQQVLLTVLQALRDQLPFVISHAHRERLQVAGTRIAVTDVAPTHDATSRPSARFTPNVDLLVFALHGDVSSADRVDVEIASPTGEPRYLLEDVPFDRETGEVLVACQRHYEGMFPGDPIFTVHAVEAGEHRTVGDYVVAHVWR